MEKKIIVINGSYRRDKYTHKVLTAEAKRLKEKYGIGEVKHFFLDDGISACHHCEKCALGCKTKDQFQEISAELETAERILLGSPVYLDMPSAKMVAFLTRLNCFAENTQREFFKDKKAHFVAVGYCSGTKVVIRALMGACEMLGLTIEGRSSKEYILLWKDKKIRGGMKHEDACHLEED